MAENTIEKKEPKFFGHPMGLAILFFTEMWERFSYYGMRGLLVLFLISSVWSDITNNTEVTGGNSDFPLAQPESMIKISADQGKSIEIKSDAEGIWNFTPSSNIESLGLEHSMGDVNLDIKYTTIQGESFQGQHTLQDAGPWQGYDWTRDFSLLIYGIYTMLVYVMSIPGGIIADKLLGQKKSVMIGGGLLVIGQLMLAFHPQVLFFTGLGVIILGVGLLKPNISTMVGGLYRDGDRRRDAGFTIFYMGINLGAFLAGIIVSLVAAKWGWHYGFVLAGFGMLLGQVVFILGLKHLKHVGNMETKDEKESRKAKLATEGKKSFSKEEWDRIIVLSISFVIVIVFWMAFEQAGGLMNIYTDTITDRKGIPAAVFQSLNAAYIMIFGGIVAALWLGLSKKGIKLSAITKMGIGTIVMGLGYLFMVAASSEAEYERIGETINVTKKSGVHWLLFAYLFHTLGELALSPVALSFITKVAPKRIVASMMGVYFAATGLANFLASWVGRQAENLGEQTVFWGLVIFTVSMGTILILFSKPLNKMTHGTEDDVDEPEVHGEVIENA